MGNEPEILSDDKDYREILMQFVRLVGEKAIKGGPGMDGKPMWISIQLEKEDLLALLSLLEVVNAYLKAQAEITWKAKEVEHQAELKEIFKEVEEKVILVTPYAIFTRGNPNRLEDWQAIKDKYSKKLEV